MNFDDYHTFDALVDDEWPARRRRMTDDVEEIDDVTCEKETVKAILVKHGRGVLTWVPKSVVHDDSEVYKEGTSGKLVVARWFAEKEGLG